MKHLARTAVASMVVLTLAVQGRLAEAAPTTTAAAGQKTIMVPLVFDQTGPAAPFATEALKGAQLAIEQFNASGGIGGLQIQTTVTDSATNPQAAASAMGKAVKDGAPVVIYGTSGGMALAMAPIAQRAKIPIINIQSGVGTLLGIGEYVYRSTPAQPIYHDVQAKYLASQRVKKVALLYNNDNATYNALGSTGYAELGKKYGFTVQSQGIASTDTDVTTVTANLAKTKPDAFVMLLQASNNTVATELRRNGFTGIIAGTLAIGLPTLQSMGDTANGIVWPDIFAPDIGCPSGKTFIADFTKKYGTAPGSLAASGYDGARMLIEGIRNAPSYDAQGVQTGLKKVLEVGVPDAAICKITFENRDPRSAVRVLQWKNGTVTTVAN